MVQKTEAITSLMDLAFHYELSTIHLITIKYIKVFLKLLILMVAKVIHLISEGPYGFLEGKGNLAIFPTSML